MAALRLTLQNRITSLMIVSSVIFIGAFTFIQLNNQLANLNRYNSYRANLSTVLVKNNLEGLIKGAMQEELPRYLAQGITSLTEAGIIQDIAIFDASGKIIASSAGNTVGETVGYKDLNKIEDLNYLSNENKWHTSLIDQLKQRLYLYISLDKGVPGETAYVAKISLPLASIQEAFKEVYGPVIFAVLVVIMANIVFGYMLSKTVIGPIKILNNVTKIIAGGDLSVRTDIHTEDELAELGSTFNYMTEELIKMKERAENANPLTKLPGNIVIHEQIDNRIKENKQFVVIYCDLDNFKAFNDKYGIAKGDEAIKLTAEVFKAAAKASGNPDDFVGHEGGDDFILVTTPEKAQAIADYIIREFDKQARSLYSQEDLQAGFIIAHARDGTVKQFPIMSISLAGVTNVHREIASYGEVTNIAAEVKKKAKAIEGSVFVMDKRHDFRGSSAEDRQNTA
jgi:diguanylate cyclase (GGDEF)-like protein